MFIFTYFQIRKNFMDLSFVWNPTPLSGIMQIVGPKEPDKDIHFESRNLPKGGGSGWDDQFPDEIIQGNIQSLDPLLFEKSFLVPGGCPRQNRPVLER